MAVTPSPLAFRYLMSAGSTTRSQRCLLPGVALAFAWLESVNGELLACDWQDPDDPRELVPLADIPGADRRPPPFAPDAYGRDASAWQPTPAVPPGSAHARRVWAALSEIPVGEVRTYSEIAARVGSAPRAVGQACRANPWPLFIPCHRVVSSRFRRTHDVGGYAGDQVGELAQVKRLLLAHEGVLKHE
ncbi:methylated-DNA--[protein]-cysteine S-methyltransferase [Thioalkalivibrio sp. ALE9]|uniref:methylated-DNA--[protein]-cysteine S-methyltransferase n=1 Tax=Thioalkalivibrio sp. ALE9 TaxID=1158169 RepID=UPI0003A006FD|nr:methylated-DNA--[protein]-cysteine S-methyltransferase [Thioalkalivibrio sp. ALE9]